MGSQLKLFVFEDRALKTPEHIARVGKWEEYHQNGKPWIGGEYIIVKDEHKELYNFLPVNGESFVRIGVWTKYFDNGQLAWQLDYADGKLNSSISKQNYPSYRIGALRSSP